MIVGGGIGIAPLLALGEECIRQGKEVRVLIGALQRKLIIGEETFSSLGARVNIATDDGSYHYKGLITDLLEEIVNKERWLPDQIFACGPRPMLKRIDKISTYVHIDCQVSLEERMGCGIGACLGCVCKVKAKSKKADNTKYEFRRICVDGPVFKSNEVIWDD